MNNLYKKIDYTKDPDALIRISKEDLNRALQLIRIESERVGFLKATDAMKSDEAIKFQMNAQQNGKVLWPNDLAFWIESQQNEILSESNNSEE